MNNEDFDNFLSIAPVFNPLRNYWLFRTQGGLYYDHFHKENFIAIGYNEINLFDIVESNKDEENPLKILTDVIRERIKDETKPGYIASQLNKFVYQIKKGDIVIIPSESSWELSIGEVIESNVTLIEGSISRPDSLEKDIAFCPYRKRKKVKWLKTVRKNKLNSNLYKLLFSHHTITEAKEYANFIDNLLGNFYVKGDEATIVLEVATQDDINARALFQLGNNLLDYVDDFCKFHNLDIDTKDVEVKLALQSPGDIQFTSKTKAIVLILGTMVVGIVGGGFKIKYQSFELDLSTTGLIQKVIDYQNHAQNRKLKQEILDKHAKTLQLQQPDDLIKVLEAGAQPTNQPPTNNVNQIDNDTIPKK